MEIALNTCSGAILFSIVSIILGSKPPYLVERCCGNHYITFGGELTPLEPKNGNFLNPRCQTEVGSHIVYVKDVPMTSLLEKPLGTGLYSLILTLQYQFPCNFNSKSLWQKNHNPWA